MRSHSRSLLAGSSTANSSPPGGDWTIDDVYLDPFKTK
jgi:hypothetical protein